MPNMTGYGGLGAYPQKDYMNDYNRTNAVLHGKYKLMNQTEVPQMKFANRQGNLNLNLIKNLDLNYVIKTNNITPLEKLCQNLIYSEIKDEDYEDTNVAKLLRTFQYALEYLNAKQSKLEQTNNKLDLEYNQLINQSYELEERLKLNKRQIGKNSTEKKEKEMLLVTYESIVNFNMNPVENTNILIKNINSNYRGVSSTMEGDNYPRGVKERFYCHICSGKYFNTETGLENHMKKRHLNQLKLKKEKDIEMQKEKEIEEINDKKLEETKSYLQNIIQRKNDMFSKENYEKEINELKRDNNEKMQLMMQYTEKMSSDMRNLFQDFFNQQNQNNQNIMDIANAAAKKEREKREEENKIIENQRVDEINKLSNSISAQLGEIIQNQKNTNKNNDLLEQENRMLRNRIENLQNNQKYINKTSINIKLQSNDNEEAYTNQPNNYSYNQNQNQSNNNIPNNNNNINIKSSNIIKESSKEYNPSSNNNIIKSQNIQDISNTIQREKVKNNSNQDEDQKDKAIVNKILTDNNILEQDSQDNDKKNYTGENFNKVMDVKREVIPNDNKENSFSKTAPNGFKKRKFIPLKPKQNMSNSNSMKELDIFYAKFMNRDQPILEDENPNPKDYLKRIIPSEKKQDDDKIINDTKNIIENKAKKEFNIQIEDFQNKDKNELIDLITKTMGNINEKINRDEESKYYYETIQKAIDWKINEVDKELKSNAYDNNGRLKRSRSSSKAKIVIENTEKEFDGI